TGRASPPEAWVGTTPYRQPLVAPAELGVAPAELGVAPAELGTARVSERSGAAGVSGGGRGGSRRGARREGAAGEGGAGRGGGRAEGAGWREGGPGGGWAIGDDSEVARGFGGGVMEWWYTPWPRFFLRVVGENGNWRIEIKRSAP